MAFNATFTANFKPVEEAVRELTPVFKGVEQDTKKLQSALNKVGTEFDGGKLITQANALVRSIQGLGGASKLTANEQARVNSTLTEALAKYRALGQQAPDALRQLADQTRQVQQGSTGLSRIIEGAVGSFAGFFTATTVMRGLGTAFGLAKGAAVDMNSSLETTTLQFETLFGNADQAREHVKSLFEFAKRTPFETGPVIEASKQLQVFGGVALNTQKTLTLVGDAAAATGAPINELATWTGRLYASLQAGRPFGEAAQRLSELAVLSPQARLEMEKLQAQGASAQQIFARFEAQLGQFAGAMDKQASTLDGLTSTIKDSFKLLAAEGLKPVFDAIKQGASQLVGVLSDARTQAAVKQFGEGLRSTMSTGITLIGHLVQGAGAVVSAFQALPGPVQTALGVAAAGFAVGGPLLAGITSAIGGLGRLAEAARVLASAESLGALATSLKNLGAAFSNLSTTALIARGGLIAVAAGLGILTGQGLVKFLGLEKDAADRATLLAEQTDRLAIASRVAGRAITDLGEANRIVITHSAAAKQAAAELATGGLGLVSSHAIDASQALALMRQHTTGATAPVVTYRDELAKLRAQVAGFTADQRAQIDAAKELGHSEQEIAQRLHLSTDAIKLYVSTSKTANSELSTLRDTLVKLGAGIAAAERQGQPLVDILARYGKQASDAVKDAEGFAIGVSASVQKVANAFRAADLQKEVAKLTTELSADARQRVAAWAKEVADQVDKDTKRITSAATEQAALLDSVAQGYRQRTMSALAFELEEIQRTGEAQKQRLHDLGATNQTVFDEIDAQTQTKMNAARLAHQEAVAEMKQDWVTWGSIARNALASVPQLLSQAFTGGGGFGGALKGLASQIGGSTLGKLFSSPTGIGQKITSAVTNSLGLGVGSAVGSILPGLGTALGGLAGGLISKLFGPSEASKANELRKTLLEQAGGLEVVRQQAEFAGVSIDKLLTARKQSTVKAAFDELQTAVKKTQERVGGLVSDLQKLEGAGGVLTQGLVSRLQQDANNPDVQAAFASFQSSQTNKLVDSLTRATTARAKPITDASEAVAAAEKKFKEAIGQGSEVETQAATALKAAQDRQQQIVAALGFSDRGARGFGAALAGSFGALTKDGADPLQAITALQPAIDAFQTTLQATGATGGAAFAQLQSYAALAKDEIGGPLLQSLSGTADGLTNLYNLGLLNNDSFNDLTSTLIDGQAALEALGKGGDASLQLLQRPLQRAWELSQDLGFEVDDGTKKLLEQAEAAGLIGDKFRPAQERMALGIDKLVSKFDDLIRVMTDRLVAGAATAASQVERAFDNINPGPIQLSVSVNGDIPGSDVPGFATGSNGLRDFGSGTLAVLHGREAVFTEAQLAALSARVPSGGSATDVTVVMGDQVVGRAVLRGGRKVLRLA